MSEYKFTYWNRLEWFGTECWANLEKTCERFPQCVEKGRELGEALIEADKKSREWMKKHPKVFKGFPVEMPPSSRGEIGTKSQEDCVECFIAEQIYYRWFQGTEAWQKAMHETQEMILNYHKYLADNPDAAVDTLDAEKDPYFHKRLAEKIEEARKLL